MNGIPDNMRFGGGTGGSFMHPVVLILMLLSMVLIFILPRKYLSIPFLGCLFLTPWAQQLYILGAHLFVNRFLVLAGWIRIAKDRSSSKTPIIAGGITRVDKVFLMWAICRAVATYLEFFETQALINQCGFLWDSLGAYFLLRYLVRDEEDIHRIIKTMAVVSIILACGMLNEKLAGWNVFGLIGGRLNPFIRDGAIRAQGPLLGPIPAGTFGAVILCLMIWLVESKKAQVLGILGIIGSLVITVTSASSTPLMTFAADMFAIGVWPLRKLMRPVRWGIVIALASLQLVMKAPVWMIINHIDLVGGNSAYHRAMLVDQFIRHFSDWWLIGVKSTRDWGWDMWDQANQFVAEGETGGLVTFVCFILLISWNFGLLGTARKQVNGERKKEWFYWLLGSTMFAYVVSFFGISFSDQTITAWYAFLAIIAAATSTVVIKKEPTMSKTSVPATDGQWAGPGAGSEEIAAGWWHTS